MQTNIDLKKCTSCRCWKEHNKYVNKKGRVLKTCLRCRVKIKDPWEIEDFNMPDSEEAEDITVLDILHEAFNDATYNEQYNYILEFLQINEDWWWLIDLVIQKGEINV
jgi:hypothetical protein